MDEIHYTRIIIQHAQPVSYYTEQELAEYAHMALQTIRRLRAVGLISEIEMAEGEPRYSEDDVLKLRRIQRMRRDLGINLAGIEVILRLSAQMEDLQRELDERRRGEK